MADSLTASRTSRLPYSIKIGLMVIGFMLLMPIASAETVKLLENTYICEYRPKLDMDYCYSKYEICDLSLSDVEKSTFVFKDEKSGYKDNLNSIYSKDISIVDKGNCKELTISAYKSPFKNVDNVLCTPEKCYYEYVWWNASFIFKQPINISVSSGTTNQDHQVKIIINASNNGTNWNWTNECVDLNSTRARFVNGTENITLDFWVEENCSVSGQRMTVWVEVDQNITVDGYIIYVYYGNELAAAESDIEATFEFGDDFSDGVVDFTNRWQSTDESKFTESSSKLIMAVPDSANDLINSQGNHTNVITELSIRDSNSFGSTYFDLPAGIGAFSGDDNIYLNFNADKITSTIGGVGADIVEQDIEIFYRFIWEMPASGEVELNVSKQGVVIHTQSGTPTTRTFYPSLFQWESGTGFVDWLFVRKYHVVDPTFIIGAEVGVGAVDNTSLLAINEDLEDFIFSDSVFIDTNIINFNTSASNTTFLLLSSMNIEKLTPGGTNVITTRIILDSVETILEEDIRTVSGTGDIGSSGTSPIIFTVASGEHNITYQFKRTGPGNINISNFDFNLIQFVSSDGNDVRNKLTLTDYNHTDTSFTTAFNWTMNKTINSSTLILVKNSLTKSGIGSTIATYFFENLETGDTSPFWQRFLSDSSDIGSVSGIYIDPSEIDEHNHSIQSRQTDAGDTVFVNGSLVDFDLSDSDDSIIRFFQVSNESTNLTDSLTLNVGTHLLVESEVLNNIGNSYFIAFFSSFSSTTGFQTPRYFIDSPNLTTAQCFTEKERTLSDNNDIGNAFAYTICEGLSVDEIYTFRLWVDVGTGETLTQLDENLLGFETTNFSITEGQVAPIASIITNPVNGTNVSGSDTITWLPFFDPNEDVVTYNLTLLNEDGTHNATIGGTVSTSLEVDWSSFQIGIYFLQVEGCDPGALCDDTNISIVIVALPTPDLGPSISFCEDSDIFRTEINTRTITDGNTSDETTITRAVCQYGCFNVTLSNWGNAGCIESDFSLSLLLIAVVLIAVFSIRRVI